MLIAALWQKLSNSAIRAGFRKRATPYFTARKVAHKLGNTRSNGSTLQRKNAARYVEGKNNRPCNKKFTAQLLKNVFRLIKEKFLFSGPTFAKIFDHSLLLA